MEAGFARIINCTSARTPALPGLPLHIQVTGRPYAGEMLDIKIMGITQIIKNICKFGSYASKIINCSL